MSTLSDYEKDTARWKYNPITNVTHTSPGLVNKVNDGESYKPFFGSTVVFIADEPCVQAVRKMQTALHESVGDLLASPLPVSTFHMTLHDLISPEKCVSDPSDAEGYRREVDDSFNRAKDMVREIQKEYAGKTIIMDADRVVNMVSKSLVLMLIPHSEEDFSC